MKRKENGSISFNTNVVNTEQYLILAKTMRANNPDSTVKQIALEIEFIDDCLAMYKTRLIVSRRTAKGTLRKNMGFQDFLHDRLDKLITDTAATN